MKKKIITLLVALMMVITLVPTTAFADDASGFVYEDTTNTPQPDTQPAPSEAPQKQAMAETQSVAQPQTVTQTPSFDVDGVDCTYDGQGHSVSTTATGDYRDLVIKFKGPNDNHFKSTNPAFVNAGTYAVQVKFQWEEWSWWSWCWEDKEVILSDTVVIHRVPITLTANDKTITYGDPVPTDLTYTCSGGFVSPDDASTVLSGTPELSTLYSDGGNVGTYDIVFDPTSVSCIKPNYILSLDGGTLTVVPKAVSVTADDISVDYGDPVPTYTATIVGLLGEDTLDGALAFDCAYTATTAIGTYPITPSGLTSENYEVDFKPGTLTVDERILNVTFISNGGSVVPPLTAPYGAKIVKPTDPTKTGYGFKGWYLDDSTFLSDWDFENDTMGLVDVTLYAKWAINTYAVKFVDFDGKQLSAQTVNYGAPATAPANPARTGYTFTGWDKAYDKITSDLTVTALYKINTFTVKFVNFDGTVLSTQTVNYGAAAIAPANPTRSGYTFASWDKDYSKITSDLVVTAQYKKNVTSDDEDIPGTYDSGSQPFPWLWIVVAAMLTGGIVTIVVTQAKRHKKTGDAV